MNKQQAVNFFNNIIGEVKKDFSTTINVFAEGFLKQIEHKLVSFGNAFIEKIKFEEPKQEPSKPEEEKKELK